MKPHHEMTADERWQAYASSLVPAPSCILQGLDGPCSGAVSTKPNPLCFERSETPLCDGHWEKTYELYREQMDVFEGGLL